MLSFIVLVKLRYLEENEREEGGIEKKESVDVNMVTFPALADGECEEYD